MTVTSIDSHSRLIAQRSIEIGPCNSDEMHAWSSSSSHHLRVEGRSSTETRLQLACLPLIEVLYQERVFFTSLSSSLIHHHRIFLSLFLSLSSCLFLSGLPRVSLPQFSPVSLLVLTGQGCEIFSHVTKLRYIRSVIPCSA